MSDETPVESGPSPATLQPVEPGLYPFMKLEGEWPTRFHLRVDPDGAGMLLANAAEAAHLSPVGVMMVYGVLSDLEDTQIAAAVRETFHGGTEEQIGSHLFGLTDMLEKRSYYIAEQKCHKHDRGCPQLDNFIEQDDPVQRQPRHAYG